MRHLRTTLDVGDETTLDALLLRAQELKRHRSQRRIAPTLAGRVIAMLFEKPSTRTRVSFQSGSALLGAHCIVLEGRDIWLSRDEASGGEALRDTARVIGGAVDLLVVRPFAAMARLCALGCDRALIDASLETLARQTSACGQRLRAMTNGRVSTYLSGFVWGFLLILGWLLLALVR